MGRINIIKLIIYDEADNTTVWGRNIQNDKNRNYLFVSARQVSSTSSTKSQVLFQRVRGKKECTSSSWGVPLLRKWWRRGGCQRWPQRSSPCGPSVSPAPRRQVCAWLLLKNITIHRDQTKKVQLIRQTMNQLEWPFAFVLHEPNSRAHSHTGGWLINTLIFCGILPQSIHIHWLKVLFVFKVSYSLLSTFSCDLSALWIKLHLGR